MNRRWWHRRREEPRRLRTDGGEEEEAPNAADSDADEETDDGRDTEDGDASAPTESPDESEGGADPDIPPGLDRSNVEVTEPGEAEPVDPKWEKPDPDDIPEFETGAEEPLTRPADEGEISDRGGKTAEDPTAGMPNEARSPGDSRIRREGTEGYIAAVELCARLPDEIRLPEGAADLVPAAVEAELEDDVQAFTVAEFDDHSPTVDALEFAERDGEIWLRIRIGVPAESIADLDPEAVRAHALQQLEGLL